MRKNWKRLSALLLALVMVLSLVPVTALAARREDDAVPIAAPDTVVHEAKPAGAVDAAEVADVPAVLAEGEENIALNKAVYASGREASDQDAPQAVDNNLNTRWSGSKMKDGGDGTATTENAVSWLVVDLLGDDNTIAVDHIASISMTFNAKVWPTACKVQVATGKNVSYADYTAPTGSDMKKTADYAGTIHAIDNENWITVAEFEKESNATDQNIIMGTDITTTTGTSIAPKDGTLNLEAIPEGVRYVRVYCTGINTNAGGTCIGIKELTVTGAIKDIPPYTEENVNAGLFDVGVTVSGNATDGWTTTYSNAGITASAASYNSTSGDGSPSGAVDGDVETCWHTNWGGSDGVGTTTGMMDEADQRYIQIDLDTAVELSALRYLPKNAGTYVSGIITRYRVDVCTDDTVSDSSTWTTVATANDATNWDAANSTSTNGNGENWYTAYFNEAVTVKHVRLYGVLTKNDGRADNFYVTAREIRLVKNGALPNPTVTEYIRHTGEIEEGTYIIRSNDNTLHNSSSATNQCGSPAPTGDKMEPGHSNDSFAPTDHLWKIAAADGGYTIQGVTAARANYLTATASGDQLALSSDSSAAVKLTFTPSGNGYQISYNDGGTTKYLRFSTSPRGWNFSTTENVVQLFKETVIEFSETSITGTVTDGNGSGVSGATVTLATGDHYTVVADVTATTDENGAYSIDASTLGNATYYVRASKAGHGTVINTATPVAVMSRKVADTPFDVELPEIDVASAKYKWSFDDASSQPAEDALTLGSGAEKAYENGGMKLTWAQGHRSNNLVRINRTNAKNCVVEFDATRNSGSKRFGLGVRMHTSTDTSGNEATYWVYIGQFENAGGWGGEIFKGTNSAGYSGGNNGPSFDNGETRHFKVTLNEGNVTLEIDGVKVINAVALNTLCSTSRNKTTVPDAEILTAGDVGFLYGNDFSDGSAVTIDNLYVFRNDPANQVSWAAPTGGTITAKYTENGVDTDITNGATPDGISAGNLITMTGTGTDNNVLDGITVKKVVSGTESELTEAELTALNITSTEESVYTFTMPAFSVKVEGKFLPKLTNVTISGTEKVGKELTAAVTSGSTTVSSGVTYQWYHQANANQSEEVDATEAGWVQCTQDSVAITSATRSVLTNDQGKKVKVVVTGDGETYASSVSVTATTGVMAEADVGVASVSLDKSGTVSLNSGATTDVTATLTSAVTGKDYTTPVTIVWTSSAESVATVAAKADNDKQATVTAVGNGTATITVTVTDVLGNAKTDDFTVNVTTKVTGITVSIPEGKDGTIYTNEDDDKTLQLTATAAPETASDKNVSWSSGSTSVATVDDNGLVTAVANGTAVITATADDGSGVTGTYTVTVKTKLKGNVTITVPAAGLKNGNTLTANVTSVTAAGLDKDTQLTYKWYRGENAIDGATGKTYALGNDDVGQTIKVEVGLTDAAKTAGYEGTVTSTATAAVGKKAAPAAPTGLSGTDCTDGDNGKISGLTAGTAYEISSDGTNWADPDNVTADGEITNLAAGTYYIRVKVADTDVQEVGESSSGITILAAGANAKAINVDTAITNGTVTVSKSKADENEQITITVTPASGYQLKAGTLKVLKADNTTVEVTAVEDQAGKYTFSMPGEAVTVTAEFEAKTYTITHSLGANVSCDYGDDAEHRITHDTTVTIQLSVPEGYELPASVTVTEEGNTEWHGYTYEDGLITIDGANVVNNLTVSCDPAVKKVFAITDNLGPRLQCNLSADEHKVEYGADKEITLSVRSEHQTGYHMPATITVTMDGQPMTLDPADGQSGYTYVVAEGGLTATLTLKKVTAAVTVAATAEQNKTAIQSVSISFSHHVEGVEGDAPHVGDTLDAEVLPADASVTYQWKRDGVAIDNATGATYTLTTGDVGKAITVTVTGSNGYEGEETSEPTAAVQAAYVAATGITVTPTTATVAVNETVTLTATVAPESATNKTVTWTSSDTAVATVENGVVTGKKAGSVTITATNSAGSEATCAVTVTAPLTGEVTFSGEVKAGQTLTANVTPAGATVTYAWFRVDPTTNEETPISNTAKTYILKDADIGSKIKVTATGTGSYTGTVSGTTKNPVVAADEEAPVDTAALETAIAAAKEAMEGVQTIDDKTADQVAEGTKFVTTAEMEALTNAIATAEEVKEAPENQTAVDSAKTALDSAVSAFNAAIKEGTKEAVDTTALETAIKNANALLESVVVAESAEEVPSNKKFVTSQDVKDTLATAIETAKAAKDAAESQAAVDAAVEALNAAVETFNAACEQGTKKVTPTAVSTTIPDSTTKVTNPDGSTTTTITKPDGSKTEITEKPDGTKETVETKKDGTVTETVETPDGVKEVVETKPDGTVTETVTDAEGAKTEKVTDPEENVTITVTDPEGEELAKVEIPAEIPEPETKFDDAADHWAAESINKVAALGLVNGVGDNKYDTESAMTRGALATVLYRLSNGKSGYHVSFSDVEIGKYYTEGVAWAAKAKVVTGYTADIFAPDDIISREQLAVMLARYAKLIGMDTTAKAESLNAFADGANTGDWTVNGVAWCVENGILRGMSADVLAPTANVTRAQVAVMLDRFIELIK